jgi:hypothetical protein
MKSKLKKVKFKINKQGLKVWWKEMIINVKKTFKEINWFKILSLHNKFQALNLSQILKPYTRLTLKNWTGFRLSRLTAMLPWRMLALSKF